MVCRAVRKVHQQVAASSMPQLPLIWSEFNATFRNLPEITDSTYVGPWLADTIRQCDGMTQMMSYWTFSDVFEEQGVVKTPFYGGYGIIAEDGIPKPVFNAFALLHELGDQRIAADSNSLIVTRRDDGSLVLAIWNYGHGPAGPRRTFSLRFRGTQAKQAWISQVDRDHGDVHTAYEAMGSPRYPTRAQIEGLRRVAALPPPDAVPLPDGQLNLSLPADNLTVVEVR